MIDSGWMLILVLGSIEAGILILAAANHTKRFFSVIPAVFWMYVIPMVLSTTGIVSQVSPVYTFASRYILPVSLLLLLSSSDVRALRALGKPAVTMMFAGSVGIMCGGGIIFTLLKEWVGPERWGGFAALCGSWIGGSANMIAVKEALSVPDAVFLPMVVVDTFVPYVWLGCLIGMKGLQARFDAWNKVDPRIIATLKDHTVLYGISSVRMSIPMAGVIVLYGMIGSYISVLIGDMLPVVRDLMTHAGWTIIVVSCMGIGASCTPLRMLEKNGMSRIGTWILYFVLMTIGARGRLCDIETALVLVSAGVGIVLIHAVFMLVIARIIRAPLFLMAVASQANIGGVASAPVVAELYSPGLATVGLLMAIMGNCFGTYAGIIMGSVCRWIAWG